MPFIAKADDIAEWEEYLVTLYENSEEAAVSMEEAYEHLTELARQPLNINTVEIGELLSIPGVDVNHANDIIEYREKYGNLQNLTELALIPSIDNHLREYLSCFLCVAEPDIQPWYSRDELKKSIRNIRHTVLATANIPTYYRAGDRYASANSEDNGNKYAGKYLGDPIKHSLRYSAQLSNHAALNLTGAKDAAEPFFCRGNKYGYDAYSFNITLNGIGIVRRMILGQFRGQFGMGLTLNNSFTSSKQALLASIGRISNTFTAHSTASDAKHLQGACATIDIGKLQLSAFASWRYIDATLNKDGTISTILTSNYHRTINDMMKKNNASQTTTGAHISYTNTLPHNIRYSIGGSIVFTHLSNTLNPTFSTADTVSSSRLYRLYHAHGQDFLNIAVDYSAKWRELTLAGECAINDCGAIASINSLIWRTSRRLTMSMAQRYYSYKYYSLYGSSLSSGGSIQNESGLLITAQWKALSHITIDAYSDIAYYPWLKYRISQSSYSWDNSITATYTHQLWSIALRYRCNSRQRDLTDSYSRIKILTWRTDQRLRLSAQMKNNHWSLRSQAEACALSFDNTSKGFIVSQSVCYEVKNHYTLYAMAAYFNTEDYDSRLYTYERNVTNSFGYSSYYGKGYRAALMAKYTFTHWLTATLKVSHTHYFDRDVIGTAERQIFSNHQTDIDLQLKIKL